MIVKKNIDKVFLVFLLTHIIIWTLIPSFSNLNLPLDTIEALAWGSNLDWGFNKHPPLSALAVEIVYQIFGNQDWAYYFLSQLFIIFGFYIVFKFSEDFFKDKFLSFLSVIILEGIYFYNFTSPEFNVNVCQIPFWALSIFYTWKCIKFEKTKDYILLGLFLGLGILSKYLFIYLLIGIKFLFISLIIKKKIRYKNYLFVAPITFLVLLPHIIWLIENNFTTVIYGLQRTGGPGELLDHITLPIIFLSKQIGILIPIFLMTFFLSKKFKLKLNFSDNKLNFLFYVVIVPIVSILLTSIIFGVKIRTMWMTPFYLFFGVLMIYVIRNKILTSNLKKFYAIFVFFFIFSPAIYLTISLKNDIKRTDYPGGEIARLVQNKWDNNFRNEIKIVIGDEWAAGNLSYHLNSRPRWMQGLNIDVSEINLDEGIIYTGNPKVLKQVCPGVFGVIRPVGYCMIGRK